MKTLTTIILLSIGLIGYGQTKIDSGLVFNNVPLSGTSTIISLGYTVKFDTVKCWMYEAVEVRSRGRVFLDTYWAPGYIVNYRIEGFYATWDDSKPKIEYLYSDRRTPVPPSHHVIYSIDRN